MITQKKQKEVVHDFQEKGQQDLSLQARDETHPWILLLGSEASH